MLPEMHKLDLARYLLVPGLAWQVVLKTTKVKLDLLTDINLLLMVQKGIWEGLCHTTQR